MKLGVAPEAAAQILVRKHWWRANRSKAPEPFDEELAAALAVITERPESFPMYSARSGRIVTRCLLAKTSCHLCFEVREEAREVWIIAARGAVQRRTPRLGPTMRKGISPSSGRPTRYGRETFKRSAACCW
jgi:hypothetical protein